MISTTETPNTVPLLIDIPETLRLLGNMPQRTYQRMRSAGKLAPKAIKMGGRVYHRLAEVNDWVIAGCPPTARWKWQ